MQYTPSAPIIHIETDNPLVLSHYYLYICIRKSPTDAMKKITFKTSQIISSMIAGTLSLLGFSCSDNAPAMYGTPTGYYEIKGTVTEESGQPVEGAKVIMRHIDGNQTFTYHGDTVVTDSKGDYMLKTSGWPNSRIRMVCKPEDNKLEADSIDMTASFKDSDGAWNHGTARETVDFSLKFKK